MEKSLFTEGYRTFLRQLRAARKTAGLTQEELAARLKETQSFVSKCERGERRIDVVELHSFCKAIGISFTDFTRRLAKSLAR
ncbi:MAG: helix-turn-helix transcriptional regulator [Bryobacteraceae bacterium]|jgi:transcriptional regulator with XRE-family HTH domain